MKTRFNLTTIKSLICLGAIMMSYSCNDDKFFELPDHNGIDAAIWDSEGSVQLYLNRAYDVISPQFGINLSVLYDRYGVHYASDENLFAQDDQYARRAMGVDLALGLLGNDDVRYVGNKYDVNFGSNRYFDIARCNNAIKLIPQGAISKDKQEVYLGQFYALRAMVYFELAKVYGGVPLILEPQDPENITPGTRSSAATVFQSVLTDLDSAISKLNGVTWSDVDGRGKINVMIATCLKAKVLLYWASPQFNPTTNPAHAYDASRWQTALDANKAAYELCISTGGRSLVSKYSDIFMLEGVANTEAIWVRTYSSTLTKRGNNIEAMCRPSSASPAGTSAPANGFVPTKRLIDAYPMADGNPIGTPGKYTYDDVMFWQNRDPRFYATIAYNGSSWPLSGDNSRKQWNYTTAAGETNIKGAYCKRFTVASLPAGSVTVSNSIGGAGVDWIELRLAEVMLNYAECANETGNQSLAKDMVRQIRVRAGVEAGSNDYGLGSANTVDQVRDLIMNERMIEFAFENKRNSDLRRTRRMHLLTGAGLQTISIDVASTAARTTLEAIVPATGLRFRESLDLKTMSKATYLTYFKPYTLKDISTNYGPYAVPEYQYFYTFHNDFVYKGADVQATIGWAGGTFDPLSDTN